MKTHARILDHLNMLLAGEIAADIQYGTHEAHALNSGLKSHAAYIRARRESEREHIAELRSHILLMGGVPVAEPGEINVSDDTETALNNDDASEHKAIDDYTNGITLAVGLHDEATANLLRHILAEEVAHKDGTETVKRQIDLAGFANWSASQFGG